MAKVKVGLVGYTGFVGSTLARQGEFTHLYRSSNFHESAGEHFDVLFCAGAPGKKWLANLNPADDAASLSRLKQGLARLKADVLVLLSTIDVFAKPREVDETIGPIKTDLQPYGLHRLELEEFVQGCFKRYCIARLPGLVGSGLKKNIIFDLHHSNDVQKIDSRSSFQFYPMVNLLSDLRKVMELEIPLIHLTAEPVTVAHIAQEGFGRGFTNHVAPTPAQYDVRSIHSKQWGPNRDFYQYSKEQVLQAVRCYVQTEATIS